MLNRRNYLGIIVAILISQNILASTPAEEWMAGTVILKIESQFYVDLSGQDEPRALGIDLVDDYLSEIGTTSIGHRYPFVKPPKKAGGTDLRPVYEIHYEGSASVPEVCERLEAMTGVVYACPALIHTVSLDHNDPRRGDQYALNLMRANAAHDITTGDRSVVIAITDTGIDTDHPDLVGNLWVNPGEDLNDNGVVDQNERNNQDDDGNGRVDDFYGWNAADNNANIEDRYGHGTHVSGIASAVTNNETGIASIGYSCAIMVVKIGPGPQITAGFPGIVYAVDAGASVINCSWRGYQSSDEGADAARHAVDGDVLIVAASGNESSTRVSFPGGYDGVMSVASTTSNDTKSGFSNYGEWIDISAPGSGILSTTMDGAYGNMDGTSMASPYVAGAAGLLRARFPDFDIEIIRDFIIYSADDLHPTMGALADLMGGGRLNVEAALLIVDRPLLLYRGSQLASDDNRNGKLDPGERATIVSTVLNRGHEPEELTVRLTCDDPDVTISVGEVTFPNIGRGESHTNTDEPFVLVISDTTIPHTTRFTVTVDAQPGDYHVEDSFPMLIGIPNILIVDDDDGLDYEVHIQRSVESLRQGWLNWDNTVSPNPGPDTMLQFRMVVWETGDASPPLSPDERWAIEQLVARGGNILLTGRNIGDDFENNHFLRNAFGAQHSMDSVGATSVIPAIGRNRPLDPDDVMMLEGLGGSGDGRISPSSMRPYAPADTLALYMYEGRVTGVAGVYRDDPRTFAKSAYLGFTFEAVSNEGTSRDDILEQFLSWFAPDLAVPGERIVAPLQFGISQLYPNPFNGMATIHYNLNSNSAYRLSICDLTGRKVALLREGFAMPGTHSAVWNATGMPSGLYIAKLESASSGSAHQSLMLLK